VYSTAEVARRLREALETIEWAVNEIPEKYHHDLPDFYAPDDWHAAMNLAHIVVYEEQLANPVMEALLAGGDGVGAVRSGMEAWFYGDSVTASAEPLAALLDRYRAAREQGIAVIKSFTAERFNDRICPLWQGSPVHGRSLQPPGWVAMKTVQHSWEHGNALLRLALFAPR
jgi:hypothetical protein